MGWLRLVGSLKLQVSFAEYSLFYRARLQKRPIIFRSLLIRSYPIQADVQQVGVDVVETGNICEIGMVVAGRGARERARE